MGKKSGIITIVISIIALCLAVVSLAVPRGNTGDASRDIQYVMYLGTNDKDTNEPVFSPDEAKEKAEDILVDHFGGYTISEANGGWENDGIRYQEYTLVIYLSDTTLDEVHAAADDMLQVFNQNSVLIQTNETATEFYSNGN